MTRTVLYIEDNPDNVRLVERLLRRRPGTSLRVATNALDGVRVAIEIGPDLVLLDNQLPDATGAEVLQQLGASKVTAAIPVVMITGDADAGTAGRLLAAGAAGVLAKPYDIHKFMSMVEDHLD
jgi:CheY-like chemotaxis protein